MSEINIEPMSIDQLAGSFVLIMGAIGSLLLVVWQSRCECDLNLCYKIDKKNKKKGDKDAKDDKDTVSNEVDEDATTDEENPRTPSLTPNSLAP